jgi:hypothetical protein
MVCESPRDKIRDVMVYMGLLECLLVEASGDVARKGA